jgi:serine phosphatase RsbU (regulator of sigma subunit)
VAEERDGQRVWLWLPAVTFIVGLLVTLALADISHRVYERNQMHLLNLRVRDAGSVVTEALPDLQATLASAAELADATGGNVAKFKGFVAPYVAAGPEHEFLTVSLWRLADLQRGPIAVVGPAPTLRRTEASGFFAADEPARKLSVIGFLRPPDLRIGYGYAPSGAGGYAVYAESPLPANHRSQIDRTSAFSGLDYALYLGRFTRPSQLLLTNTSQRPLSGPTATVRVPFGDTSLTVEMSSRSSLSGELPKDLPWIILISGMLLVIIAAAGAWRLIHGRRVAERLASENRSLYAEQRSIAQTLQHALLPERLPAISGVQTAARYEAGERSVDIGGDWYDLIERPGERLLLVIGDVSGRGLRAATTMASLRHAIRAYAAQNDDPPTILRKLSQLLSVTDDRQFATVLCVEVTGDRQELTVTSAGHLPPLLIGPDQAAYVDVQVGLPVGVQRGSAYSSTTVSAPAGATLLAFTDGLVERRGETLDVGLARLARLAANASREDGLLSSLLDTLLTGLRDGLALDDIAIVGLRWTN